MLKSYVIIAWRNIVKYKLVSAVNIFGLAMAYTCTLAIALYLIDEYRFDRHIEGSARVLRITSEYFGETGSPEKTATTPPAVASAIVKSIPEVESAIRIFPGWGNKFFVRTGNKKFTEKNVLHADAGFFDVFTATFIAGTPPTALRDPGSIVLTKSMATKYFGSIDVIGKSLEIDDWQPSHVTAVIEDIPTASHFHADFIVPLSRFLDKEQPDNWSWMAFYTYVKAREKTDMNALVAKLSRVLQADGTTAKKGFHAQQLTSIHLNSDLQDEIEPNGNAQQLNIVGVIAAFVLLIAMINYINLTTAFSSRRLKEIGIRQVSGASKRALVIQLITEATITSLLALILAAPIMHFLLPYLNNLTGKSLHLFNTDNFLLFILLVFSGIITGMLSGIYPAVFIASLNTAGVLKGETSIFSAKMPWRKALVVFQFAIAATLITSTITVYTQVDFMQHAKPGYDKENILTVNDTYYIDSAHTAALKNEWLKIPGVVNVTAADGMLTQKTWVKQVKAQGSITEHQLNFLSVDPDYLKTMKMYVVEGRDFSPRNQNHEITELILNEAAARELALKDPVAGKLIAWKENPKTQQVTYAEVIGVVKDFHFTSMKEDIAPFAFASVHQRKWNYAVRIAGTDVPRTIEQMKKVWDKVIAVRPFEFSFLDETYDKLYSSEKIFKEIISSTAIIAIFIACFGLFGLSSLLMHLRAKEMGIRKVFGASWTGLTAILCRETIMLLIVASVISLPAGWWATNLYLNDFAYRTPLHWWYFATGNFLVLAVALITVSYHTIKTAFTNPVKNLRNE